MRLRIFTEPQQGATYEQLLAVAQLTEELGFDAFFRSDHYLRIGGGDGLPGPTDSYVTLGALARETSRIRLGTLLTSATFRLPAPLAVSVAQVDAMSGGRVELGLGAGWYEEEHRAYGIPFGSGFGERFDRLEEQLEIVTGLWSTPPGERFSFRGKHYTLVDSPALPKPAQERIPVIVGGYGSRRTPRLAARFADEFNVPFPPLDYYPTGVAGVRAACDEIDRDPATLRYSVALVVCVGADEAEVDRRAAAIGRAPDELRTNGVAGLPAEAVQKIQAFGAAGADTVYLQVLDLDDLDHLRLIAAEVAPHVRD